MLLFEKCKLSWDKFFVKCFPSVFEDVVYHISDSGDRAYDESDRDCTTNDCPYDFDNDFGYVL